MTADYFRSTSTSTNNMAILYKLNEDDMTQSKSQRKDNLYISSACAYIGALSFGYMIGYTSPALPDMQKKSALDETEASWFGSLSTFGAMLGGFLAGYLVEKLGRKLTLIIISLPFIVGWGAICLGSGVFILYFGRLLTGVGSGMCTVTCPMYIAETSTKELRGMLGSGVQLSITVGILLVYLLGLQLGWRSLAAVGLIFPVVSVVLTLRIPETPRYFLLRGRKQEALRTLVWLRGPNADVEDECRDIEESLDPDDKISFSEFKKPELFQPLKVSLGLMLLQQFTGINAVMFYTVTIFESAGFTSSPHFATVAVGAVQVAFTLIACFLMDRVGRRFLLLVASAGMGLSSMTMAYYYNVLEHSPNTVLGPLALGSLILYTMSFAIGWGPIPMLIMSEIFPVRARGPASAMAAVTSWTCAFIITKEFTTLQAILGQDGTFCFFGLCTFIAMVFVYKTVPETKGKSLEDIELYFVGRALRGI